MSSLLLMLMNKHWRPASWVVVVAVSLLWLGYKTDDMTVTYLDEFFVSEAQAQTTDKRLSSLEDKMDSLEDKLVEAIGGADTREASRIETDIFRLRVESCMQPRGALRASFEERIAKLTTEWRKVTNQPGGTPPVPTCAELGEQ